jgi:hypothetical protein
MDSSQNEVMERGHQTSEALPTVSLTLAARGYRRPRIVTIGTASELVQQNSTGHQTDGPGGWYVWGS